MKRTSKRVVSMLLSLAMLFALLPAAALAANAATAADEEGLIAAVASAGAGDSIQLEDNITLDATLAIPESAELTLDLNGHTLSVSSDIDVIDNSGTLTVKNGTVAAMDKGSGTKGMAVDNLAGATLTVLQDEGMETKLIGRSGIQNYAVATVYGGTVESYNRNAYWGSADSQLTVHDGNFTSPTGSSGYGRAISTEGDVTIYGGTFYSGGTSGAGDNYMNAIGMFNGAELVIQPTDGKTVTVTSETDYAVSTMGDAKVTIYGGDFSCNGDRSDLRDFTAGNIQISGGTFLHEPNADYLADGCISFLEDGRYVVQETTEAADVTVDSYESLAAALNGSVLEPKNITLSADVTIPADADLTLQQGYTLTIPAETTLTVDGILRLSGAMTNNGTLTVTAGGFVEHPLNLTNNGTITDFPTVENGVCTVSTPMELQWLTCLVEWDHDNIPATIRLGASITMPDVVFDPIGQSETLPYANSEFDGDGKEISGLTVTAGGDDRGSLFGVVEDVEIRNLTLKDGSVTSTNGYIGSLAGLMKGSCTVQNVHVQGYTVSSSISYGVGGFAGQLWTKDAADRFEFIGCTLDADVTGYANQGGVWGTSTGSLGTVGIYNCTLTGTVTTINVNGGICGGYGASAPVEIIGLDYTGLTATVKGEPTDKLVAYTETASTSNIQPDKAAVKVDGVWTAVDASAVVATVDGMPYTSFASAIADAKDGSAVQVKQDISLTESVSISKNITLTGLSKISLGEGGALTISAGTYDANPAAYVAAEYVGKANSDGTYTVVPMTVENAVAYIAGESGGTYYNSVTSAVKAAQDGQTIQLMADVQENDLPYITKTVTLDLNGYTLTTDRLVSTGNLTIQDSTVTAAPVVSSDYETVTYASGKIHVTDTAVYAADGGTVTLVSGTIESDYLGAYAQGDTTGKAAIASTFNIQGGYIIAQEFAATAQGNGAVLNISGGVLVAKDNAVVAGNGTKTADKDLGGTAITISGGTIIGHILSDGYIACGVYHPQQGTLTITGGTIYADGGVGVLMRAGTASITGGTIMATGTASGKVGDSRIIQNCYGIIYDEESKYPGMTDADKVTVSGDAKVSADSDSAALYVWKDGGSALQRLVVEGGSFSSDPTDYLADNKAAVEGSEDGYLFTVTDKTPTAAEVVVAEPSVGEPDLPADISKEEQALADSVQDALTGSTAPGITEGALSAAAGTVANENTVTTSDKLDNGKTVLEALNEVVAGEITGEDVTIVVQPYMDIAITGVSVTTDGEGTSSQSITLDIKPMYRTVATTANVDQHEDIVLEKSESADVNAIVVGEPQELTITRPVTVTIPLPTGFASEGTLYIEHAKSNGSTYHYTGTVDASGVLTFVNPKGFSEFTISSTNKAVASIDGVGYATLEDAIDDVTDGQTIVLLSDDLSASVHREISFRIDANGTTGLSLRAGTGYKMEVDETTNTYTFTYVGSSSGVATYAVTVESAEHGTVKASTSRASKGATVTITVTPDEDYVLDTLTVTDKNGNSVTLTEKSDTQYTFVMPASSVTIKGTFTLADEVSSLPFTDVAVSDWYYEAVKYTYDNGLMNGTSSTQFTPKANLTRAMIAQVLYNMEKDTAAAGSAAAFTDVASDAWYADAVNWAAANDIVTGYPDGTFGPEKPITREQMATILYRYAQLKGYDTTQGGMAIREFSDYDKISEYAMDAMTWAVNAGVLSGKGNGVLDPTGTATRAEVAQILMNFCENVAK